MYRVAGQLTAKRDWVRGCSGCGLNTSAWVLLNRGSRLSPIIGHGAVTCQRHDSSSL